MEAYSQLKQILIRQRLSIPELHRRIRGSGFRVNVKSLYRLTDEEQPVTRLDMRVAAAICQVCEVPLSDWIVFSEDSGALRILASDKQVRLEKLMGQNNEGSLSHAERSELQTLVREAEEITLANARTLAAQRRRLLPPHPIAANGAS